MKYLIEGKLYNPIKIGDKSDWYCGEPNCTCGDCAGKYGEVHSANCDIERCPACGGQFISCSCGTKYEVKDNIKPNELNELIKKQIVENIAVDLEIQAITEDKVKYDGPEIYMLLANIKLLLIKNGKEHEFEDIRQKVVHANTKDEALIIMRDFAVTKMNESKKEAEL